MLKLRSSIAHGLLLNLQISKREDEIPICSLYVGDSFNRALAKLRIRQREILFGDFRLASRLVNSKPAYKRLRVAERECRWECRIQCRESVVGGRSNRRKIETVVSAELRRKSLYPCGSSDVALCCRAIRPAAKKTRRRCCCSLVIRK